MQSLAPWAPRTLSLQPAAACLAARHKRNVHPTRLGWPSSHRLPAWPVPLLPTCFKGNCMAYIRRIAASVTKVGLMLAAHCWNFSANEKAAEEKKKTDNDQLQDTTVGRERGNLELELKLDFQYLDFSFGGVGGSGYFTSQNQLIIFKLCLSKVENMQVYLWTVQTSAHLSNQTLIHLFVASSGCLGSINRFGIGHEVKGKNSLALCDEAQLPWCDLYAKKKRMGTLTHLTD